MSFELLLILCFFAFCLAFSGTMAVIMFWHDSPALRAWLGCGRAAHY